MTDKLEGDIETLLREKVDLAKRQMTSPAILAKQIRSLICRHLKLQLPENPYGSNVHLDAGVYDGLHKRVFDEALQQVKELNPEWYEGQ